MRIGLLFLTRNSILRSTFEMASHQRQPQSQSRRHFPPRFERNMNSQNNPTGNIYQHGPPPPPPSGSQPSSSSRSRRSRGGSRRSHSSQTQAQKAPAFNLEKYVFDEVTKEDILALDIYPQIADDLVQPGKGICYITQIITVAGNQMRNAGEFDFRAELVGPFWVGSLTISFPKRRTFTCKHSNKKECKNLCALAAIYNLRKDNSVDPRLKVNIDTSVANNFLDNSRGPVPLTPIPMNLKQQMMSFVSKFDEYISNLVDYRIDTIRAKYERSDFVVNEGKADILEGLDPDEGIVTSDSLDKTESFSPSDGPIDIFTSRPYRVPNPRQTAHGLVALRKVFSDRQQKYQTNEKFQDMCEAQSKLPIRRSKEEILENLCHNRVIVVAGETGSGKSTQVPQFILENFITQESNASTFVNIAITQPRRISAISLAERVASELGEPAAGYSVGHNVRFDSKQPKRDLNIMTFFTTGMLLKKIQHNPDLKGVSHLVIDEVHERDCTTDFALILVKRLLERRRDIKIILMSASMDASLFSRYFDNCPIVSVSGRCYPVQNLYLNDIYKGLGVDRSVNEHRGRVPKTNTVLIADLIKYIDETRESGAMLCFLPGWKEMKDLQTEIGYLRTRNRIKTLLVHSRLPVSEQKMIFSKVGAGERKVILATNIAETSITINDVRYVIDSGLCNSIDYDYEMNISSFATRWISRANAKQRSGRAGRTSPGECFKLYTRDEESLFQEFPAPQLLRIPLESVIMEAKCHCPDEQAARFLAQAIQHPSLSAIHNAIDELMLLGVLDSRENLTTLGKRISGFSTHPRLSVSLVVAAALRTLYPALNASAVLSATQEPFVTALYDKAQIRETKERLCYDVVKQELDPINYTSDHISFGNLLAQYDNATMSKHEHDFFIEENYLNRSSMASIIECRNLNASLMISSNFVSTYDWYSFDSLPNQNMNELDLVIASFAYAFYPKVARVVRGIMSRGTIYRNKVRALDAQTNASIRFSSESIVKKISLGKQSNSLIRDGVDESDEDSDYASMGDQGDNRRHTFITYMNSRVDQESGQVIVRDGSVVPPLTLLLFGGRDFAIQEINARGSDQNYDNDLVVVTLDNVGLLSFRLPREDATAIREWRRVWQNYLDWFIHTRNTALPVDKNDSIIGGTMNEFLEMTKKLYSSVR